ATTVAASAAAAPAAAASAGGIATADRAVGGSPAGEPATGAAEADAAAPESPAAGDIAEALTFDDAACTQLAAWADGDARRVINAVEVVAEAARGAGRNHVDSAWLETALSQNLRRFDKGGDAFYDQISALHKAVRGSD